jgi:hypothetical protein
MFAFWLIFLIHKQRSFKDVAKLNNITKVLSVTKTQKYDCPPVDPDGDQCSVKYGAANDAVTEDNPYSASASISAVNEFITACSATKCQKLCETFASDVTWEAVDEDEEFAANCLPVASVPTAEIGSTVCEAEPAPTNDDETCVTSYQKVITATTTSTAVPIKAWVATDVQTAIDEFGQNCPKTACVSTCNSVISLKNVANEYTSLKTSFVANCNPNPPTLAPATSPPDDSSLSIKNNLLFMLLSCGMSLGLLALI